LCNRVSYWFANDDRWRGRARGAGACVRGCGGERGGGGMTRLLLLVLAAAGWALVRRGICIRVQALRLEDAICGAGGMRFMCMQGRKYIDHLINYQVSMCTHN